jgi:intracellular sulfur oxidation DsrE/DsrF family protein
MKFLCSAVVAVALLFANTGPGTAAEPKQHRVAIQVDQNDADVMNLALNNATNIMEQYKSEGETVEIEIVTYGPGLHMLRADTSPVKDRIKQIVDASFPSGIRVSACNNTKEGMEKREGRAVSLIPEAELVPSGAVRLIELQENGWSYLRP